MNNLSTIFNQRRAGILAHITSLPGPQDSGDLGENAYYFIDFLKKTGCSVWQTLPLGMPHEDGSPYQCMSAHAGNTELISRQNLVTDGWLNVEQLHQDNALNLAYDGFIAKADPLQQQEFAEFCDSHAGWLDDYALYCLYKNKFDDQAWFEWPKPYRDRHIATLRSAKVSHRKDIANIKFQQFIFFQQWLALRVFARQQEVLLFGDIPLFVAYDSADVWAERDNFKLNEDGSMPVVAGVPPDYFSETGQRWGNPHYNWDTMQNQGFDWWLKRIQTQLQLFDIIRIDHFRGLEAAWEVPASEPTAIKGAWVKAPGQQLLKKIQQRFGNIALVAEDLGVITPEVVALRDDFALPGMRILQFGFGDDPTNTHAPHNCTQHCVIYTGTHDNDTTLGWYQQLNLHQQAQVDNYIGSSDDTMPDTLINWALASVAQMAVLPMQDVLALDGEHRMNVPGTIVGNWSWRFNWDQLTEQRMTELHQQITRYGRLCL